jgi:hypothetical protein
MGRERNNIRRVACQDQPQKAETCHGFRKGSTHSTIYNIVSSSFPNWEGEAQTRNIDKLTAEEFVNTNSNVGSGGDAMCAPQFKGG